MTSGFQRSTWAITKCYNGKNWVADWWRLYYHWYI